jgi:hypothetical protein
MSYDDQAASHYGYRIDGNGMAVNPATGKLESLYARAPSDPLAEDWSDFRFASDPRGLTGQHQGLTGWAPGYYTDNSGTFDNFLERAVLGGLGAITAFGPGAAALAGSSAAPAATEATAPTQLASLAAGDTMTDAPIAWDTVAPAGAAAPAPPPAAMAGGATDLGGGVYVDEFGNTTGGAFAGGPGTAGSGDFAASAPWYQSAAKTLGSIPGSSKITDGLTLKYFLDKAARGAPAALGAYGANQQAEAYKELSDKYMGLGAPSRDRYESSFQPGFTMASDPGYSDALAQTTKETLHQLSPGGNPAGSPNAWEQTLKDVNAKFAFPALDNYRRTNAGAGGLAALTSAAPGAASAGINADRGVYDAIGAGAADIFSPPRSLSDLLREMKRAGY